MKIVTKKSAFENPYNYKYRLPIFKCNIVIYEIRIGVGLIVK